MSTSPEQLRRLHALGIDVWVRRDASPIEAPVDPGTATPSVPEAAAPTASGSVDEPPPIRLAPGRGRWLLVLEGSDRPELRPFLDDLRALLGADACRFGQWSDTAESGVPAGEWAQRGIEWVLDFGGTAVAHPAVLNLPPADELLHSAAARRSLWQTLRPLLEAH